MRFLLHSSLALFFLSVGCAPSRPPAEVQSVRMDPTAFAVQAAQNGKLTCSFDGECEPALAMISVATKEGLSRCTGFLISDHEILTNDHCLDSIPRGQYSCEGKIFVHFSDDVHRDCKTISVRSGQTGFNSKDYAVLVLSSPVRERRPLTLSSRGFENGEPATVMSVQPTSDTAKGQYDGYQLKRACEASFPTIMNSSIRSSDQPLMTFGDCNTRPGNSGSPVFNSEGHVGAVLQGYMTVSDESFSESLKPYLLDGSYGAVAMGTQSRCISKSGASPSGCENVFPIQGLYPESYLREEGAFSEKILPVATEGRIWKATQNSQYEKNWWMVPACASAIESSPRVQILQYRLGLNSRLRAEWRKVEEAEVEVSALPGADRRTMEWHHPETGTISLPVCP